MSKSSKIWRKAFDLKNGARRAAWDVVMATGSKTTDWDGARFQEMIERHVSRLHAQGYGY